MYFTLTVGHYIKKQKLLLENKPLKKFLKKLEDEASSSDEETSVVKKPKTAYVPQDEEPEFSPYIPEENFMNDYDEGTIKQLWDQQQGFSF